MRYKDSDILFKKLFYCYLKKKKMCLLYIASNTATKKFLAFGEICIHVLQSYNRI